MATAARGQGSVDGSWATLKRLAGVIDTLSEWSGRIFAWLIIPLVASLTYEVLARYVFAAPTIWAYDLSYMLYGAHFMLGAGYTLLKGGHIRTDIFYQNWSPRTQGRIDALLYLLLFFPGMIFFFWMGAQEGVHSLLIGEKSDASPWRPILWPLKLCIPVAAILLLIQGIAELIRSSHLALRGRPL